MGMKAPVTPWETTVPSRRIEWADVKDRVDLGIVTTALLGPAPGRRGQKGRGLWWSCPFHQDKNPSFQVDSHRGFWKCYGCSEYGDAPSLVMRLRGITFPEAVRWLAEQSNVIVGATPSQSKNQEPPVGGKLLDFKPASSPALLEPPSGIPLGDALSLVESAASRLWSVTGATSLEYLRHRGLEDQTIKAARLGVVRSVAIPKKHGTGTWNASGITIPWFDGDRLALVKVRQPEGRTPKYGEVKARSPSDLSCPFNGSTRKAGRHLRGRVRRPALGSADRRHGPGRHVGFSVQPSRRARSRRDAGRPHLVSGPRWRPGGR